MSIEITIPAWEDTTVTEASLANWFAHPGAQIHKGQALGEIMAQKATVEIVAPSDGVIQEVRLARGDVVKPGMVVATLEPVEEPVEEPVAPGVATANGATANGAGQAQNAATSIFVLASPAARRLARELGVQLERVKPVDGQRITEDDVRRTAAASAGAMPVSPALVSAGEPLTGLRKVIAERMLHSLQSTAQLTLTTEVRADALVAARKQIQQRYDVTYTDLLAWITIQALKQHPALNATLEGDILRMSQEIHLGLAVSTNAGLLVPVVRNAETLTFKELVTQTRMMAERARSGASAPGELSGSTFSLTTLGAYEIDTFTPILNPPEVSILGIGRVREAIIPVDGKPALGHLLALSLTFDHRALDGAPAAAFLQTVKRITEAGDVFRAETAETLE